MDTLSASGPDAALNAADAQLDAALERLFALLRIPSISTQPDRAADCRRAAEWLCADLRSLGFEAAVRETAGLPAVVAHDRSDAVANRPHVLFYGHYDVQPVDPLPLWHRDPFDPALLDAPADASGRSERWISARGASDDKGQVMTFLEAVRAIRATGGELPVRVSVLIEGEEENGSPSLVPFLRENRDEFAAEYALVCDTGMMDDGTPAITTMLRGLVGEEVVITAADRDLHSGMFGGAARNPLHVMAEVLASLRDADGRVTLPGFYDDVRPLPPEVRAAWDGLGQTDAAILNPVGLGVPAGEAGYSALEQVWSRPTCEVNGVSGGYGGEGFKTVLPGKATAKVSFRLVADQDPEKVRDAFRAHVRARIPADCSVAFHAHGGSPASSVPIDSPPLRAALDALTAEWERKAVVIGGGGSIPVVRDLQQILGLDSLLVGFGKSDDRLHSPNEKYDLSSFRKGTRSWVRILYRLGAARD